jgi:hypothetical protein
MADFRRFDAREFRRNFPADAFSCYTFRSVNGAPVMRPAQVFAVSVALGAAAIAALAAENTVLALMMGAALGGAVAIMIIAFPLDFGNREPTRGKREVHVVMVEPDRRKR